METCLRCGRKVNRISHGRGPFRKHVKSKGILCNGSWEFPYKQREAVQKLIKTKWRGYGAEAEGR